MAQSGEKKIEINLVYLFTVVVAMAAVFALGIRSNNLSKKQEQAVAENAVLTDNIKQKEVVINSLSDSLVVLKRKVNESDVVSAELGAQVTTLKIKYEALQLIEPSPCDTFVKYVECDQLVDLYENYVEALKLNVQIRQNTIDTLQLQNTYLEEAYKTSLQLSDKLQSELLKNKTALRRSRTLNYVTSSAAVVSILFLIL